MRQIYEKGACEGFESGAGTGTGQRKAKIWAAGVGKGQRKTLLCLETDLLEKLLIAFLFDKKRGPVVTVVCLQNADAELRSASIVALMFDREVLHTVGGEEIPDDHFSLYLTVGIAFIRKGDINPVVQIPGKFANIAGANGVGDVIECI